MHINFIALTYFGNYDSSRADMTCAYRSLVGVKALRVSVRRVPRAESESAPCFAEACPGSHALI